MNPRHNQELAPMIERTRERMANAAMNVGHAAVESFGSGQPESDPGIGHNQLDEHSSSKNASRPHETRSTTGYAPFVGLPRVSIVGDRSERLRSERENSRSRRRSRRR